MKWNENGQELKWENIGGKGKGTLSGRCKRRIRRTFKLHSDVCENIEGAEMKKVKNTFEANTTR